MISSYISLGFNLKYLKGKGYYVRDLDFKARCVLSNNLALLIRAYLPLKLNCSSVVEEQMIRSTEGTKQLFWVLKAAQRSSCLSLPVSCSLNSTF